MSWRILRTKLIYSCNKTEIQTLQFDTFQIPLPVFNNDYLLHADGLEVLNTNKEKVNFKGYIRFVVKNVAFEYAHLENTQVIHVEVQPHRDSEGLWFAYQLREQEKKKI